MKKFILFALACVAGAAIGFIIASLGGKEVDITSGDMLDLAILIVTLFIAAYLQIILHEAGHLLCGLLSGYNFVSFRIGSFTIIKQDGKLRIKRFNLAGTGGQCLMSPPRDVALDEVPTFLYNAGGVLMNILTATIALVLLITCKDMMPNWLIYFLAGNMIIGYAFALLNGIPMKIGGIANDGHNMLHLGKNKQSVKGFSVQLIANEMIQNGTRPADMPKELFDLGGEIDYSDPLQCNVELMRLSHIIDTGDISTAHEEYKELMLMHGQEMLPMLNSEARIEQAYTCLATGDKEMAQNILNDKKLMNYIKAHASVMSSKQRLLMAKALILDGDRNKAQDIYDKVVANSDNYLMQGEVASDIDLMKQLLGKENVDQNQPKTSN